jgi:hypothetical protein
MMKYIPRTVVCLALALLAWAQPGLGQTVTTGTITGIVTDQQGGVLPGATVAAVHEPTGTTYEGLTDSQGRFTLLNVRVGGPYEVTAQLAGFREREVGDVQVALGEARQVDFELPLATITETVTVSGEAPPLDSSRAGTASNVSREAIETLPTVGRSLFDFARLSPHFTPIALNEDPNSISVAGQNNRYNNVQIDGAVNNDVFGLSASGAPGGQTETEPVSLDAIQELQLVVSPYDVRQGMFAGGGINAITRSGTNEVHGTGYYFGRNQSLVGDSPTGTSIADFSSHDFGASLGGHIVRNRAFYFGNVEFGRRETPSGISISGTGQPWGAEAEAERFLDILRNRYGYDPGDFDEFIRDTKNDKAFVRTDFNVAAGHQLTVRNNFVNGLNDIGRPDVSRFVFPDNFYRFDSKTNSLVTQLNSVFGRAFNELRFTYQRQRDLRGGQPFEERPFPSVEVRVDGGSRFLRAGRENFSSANELDVDIVEVTDDYTMVRGEHTLTVGTHNEFYQFRNLFIRDAFGNYRFSNLDLFEQGFAASYDYSFSLTNDPRQPAEFGVNQFGVYIGDQWRPNARLTATFGVRLDLPTFPDSPTHNPEAEAIYGFRTDEVPNQQLWSPRFGITYALDEEADGLVRAGIGLFTGRTPYVWLSNQYTSTGIEFQRISVRESSSNRIPFVPDASAQPTNVTGGSVSRNEIDLIDPDYKYPHLIRGNVGYDREIAGGWVTTVELLFSKTVQDIKYQNLNLRQVGTRLDRRPVFSTPASGAPGSQYGDVIFLTNTDQGHSWTLSVEGKRSFRSGWFANASYMYGQSRSIMDGTSSQAASNWGNAYTPGDPNNLPLARSNFDPGHRINLALSRELVFGGTGVTVSGYYSGQSGRPYSLNYSSDFNGDGRTTNDLLYVPASAGEVTFTGGTFDQFMAFINSEECYAEFIGRIVERNACRAPWINTFDVRFAVNVPTGGRTRTELTFDLSNLTNLFGNEAGLLEYANFNDILVVRPSVSSSTGATTYDIGSLTRADFERFTRDDLKSRWQGKFGVRVRF